PKLDVDEHGWVKRLEPGCYAETPMCTIDGGHFPSGVYTVFYCGKGKITFMNATVQKEEPGRIEVAVESKYGAFWLQIRETDPENPIRDIRVYMPGYGTSKSRKAYGEWNPGFLATWRGVDTVRFMDMQETNNSELEKWSDRPVREDGTFTRNGAPVETLCDLANRLDANPWFCVPHLADDDFVRNMARTIRKNLKPGLKVYVEYSNEVWNGQFKQCQYAEKMGKAILPDGKPWECAWAWTGHRSVEIFKIFEKEFGPEKERLVRVIATQAANAYVSERILEVNDAGKHADALAIAPYVMQCINSEWADGVVSAGVPGCKEYMEKTALPQAIKWIQEQKKIADKYGLELVCYEAGQHLVGLWGANDRPEVNEICYAVNASEEMGKIYEAYFRAWEECGGGLMCHFSSTGQWSKWGCWGLRQYADEKPEQYPKFREFLKAMERWNK
ncbi:MAG: hypothetical protein Q4C70_07740, partial [Planctomycetia bacterium]|nr:hypothetical protein [Planctomycetia bacterium]